MVQALIVSQNRAPPQWYRHSKYHKTEHCHIGTGTQIITKQSTATLIKALIVSHSRVQHIGTDNHSITKQSTATVVQALPIKQSIATLVQALIVSHNRVLPHWYRHTQYHTTDHCHIGIGTHSITKQSTTTMVQALTLNKTEHCHIGTGIHFSYNRVLPNWYRHSQHHKIGYCDIGTGTDTNTKQGTATLVQALKETKQDTATLLLAFIFTHHRTQPHWCRYPQSHTIEHCRSGTGTYSIR